MKKEYVQYGKTLLIIQIVVIILVLSAIFLAGFKDPFPLGILIFVLATFIFTIISFYKLTITIDETHLSFSLGAGFIRKSYLLSDIQSCTPVKNSFLSGIGIHMTGGGWLFNVSGSYSIELRFKSHTGGVRIGTDRPDEIAAEVASRIGKQQASSYFETSGKRKYYVFALAFPLIIFGVVALIIFGNHETKFTISPASLTVGGMYGTILQYGDISEADTLVSMPSIRMRTNGYAAGNVLKGHFRLEDGSDAILFVSNASAPFIKIKTPKAIYYLNGANPAETRSLYKGIAEGRK
jgi:hypothetical protein